jgi:hypothetical protein
MGGSPENINYILKTRRFTGTNFYSRNKKHSKITAPFQNECVNERSFIQQTEQPPSHDIFKYVTVVALKIANPYNCTFSLLSRALFKIKDSVPYTNNVCKFCFLIGTYCRTKYAWIRGD